MRVVSWVVLVAALLYGGMLAHEIAAEFRTLVADIRLIRP